MLKFSRFALLSALLTATACAQAADDKAVALVNGVSIPQARVDLRVKDIARQGQPDSPDLRGKIREELVTLEFLSQAAAKAGFDKQPETVQRLEIIRQNILADALVQDYAKNHPITDEMLKQETEAFKKRLGNTEYHLSYILVGTEEEAKKAAAELKKGAKFAKVAKSMSKDLASKDKGGDLGWTIPAKFLQPLAEAILQLKVGQVSPPIQTQLGWHLLKLEEKTRELKLPPPEEIKAYLEDNMQKQAISKYIEELRGKAKIE